MRLKKNLKSSAQAITEYVVIFAVLLVGIVIVCGGFNPGYENNLSAAHKVGRPVMMRLVQVFQDATNGSIEHIADWR
ncbi:MAG: hypothetical protein NTU54_08240 [Candidatus Omnitrophica bacterium]|nr:hypothetical protein [Candidatus Omnitrophota bacterium]